MYGSLQIHQVTTTPQFFRTHLRASGRSRTARRLSPNMTHSVCLRIGFSFVEYESMDSCRDAVNDMNGKTILGKKAKVQLSKRGEEDGLQKCH